MTSPTDTPATASPGGEEEAATAYVLKVAPLMMQYRSTDAEKYRASFLAGSRWRGEKNAGILGEAKAKLYEAIESTGSSTLHWKLTMEALALLEKLEAGK